MRYIYFILFALFASPVFSADVNGYTAQYECKAGGTNCNVDVATYTTAACAQTITTADSLATIESKLDTGSSPICVTNGDYTGKGTITITASGTSGAYRVMRYYRASDSDDDPWDHSDANKAKILRLDVNGSYWIVHRLTFPGYSGISPDVRIVSGAGKTNHIFNRLLVEGDGTGSNYYGYSQDGGFSGYSDLTVQNSVFRNLGPYAIGWEAIAVNLETGSNLRAVNNEIYDWVSHGIQTGNNNGPTLTGVVLENNDVYVSSALYTNGGQRAKSEDPISIKHSGTSASPTKVIHNRVWGSRWTDSGFCCNGQGGGSITVNTPELFGYSYMLFENNIIFDSQAGLSWYFENSTRQSVVGNIFYKINKYLTTSGATALGLGTSTTEAYLNTFVDNEDTAISLGAGQTSLDIRCNALISAGTLTGTPEATSQADYNTFYDTNLFTFNGTATNINKTVSTRTNSTFYALGAIIILGTPLGDGSSRDFMYMVTDDGTSASSPPSYGTVLGGSTTDGTMVVTAIRGPYAFYRKLRTGEELFRVPYAAAHNSAPEYQQCTAANMGSALGSRTGVGVDNQDIF